MDATASPALTFLRTVFRWQRGRQQSGCDKLLLLQSRWPLPFDVYVLRFRQGAQVPPQTAPVAAGRHYRCNIVVKRAREGGDFVCATPIFATRRIKIFRPDTCEHGVARVERGSRYVLSIGWVRRPRPTDRPYFILNSIPCTASTPTRS